DGQRIEFEPVNDGLGIAVVRVAGDFLRKALTDFGGRAIGLLRDAETRRVGEKLVEQAFQHYRLSLAHGEQDGFVRVRLRALLLDAEVFVDDEPAPVFTFSGT